jgi:hypothetical protein
MKNIRRMLLYALCVLLFSKGYSQDTKGYNYLILPKIRINTSLQNAKFDHYIFKFEQGSNDRFNLSCMAYTLDGTLIGQRFDLDVVTPNPHPKLRNLKRGTLKLSRDIMKSNGINGAKKMFFVPVRYKDQLPGPDYVSYDIVDELKASHIIKVRIDPSPPAL